MEPRPLRLALAAGLAAATTAAFLPVLWADFLVVDDGPIIWKNAHVLGGLSPAGLAWAFTTRHFGMWHPLAWVSHQLDVSLFGLHPMGHHATSLLLHTASVLLAFFALARMTQAPWRSALVAALFGLHPLRVESVAWLAERKDVLCTFFCLLTVVAYVAWNERRTALRAAAVVAAFCCACLSKPMAVTLPAALLLLDLWPLGRADGWTRRVVEKLPLFAVSAFTSVMTVGYQRGVGAMQTLQELPFAARLAQVPVVYAVNLRRVVWPSDLAFQYPRVTPGPGEVALAVALLAVLLCGAAVLWRRTRAPLVGLLWFLGVMFPTTGIVQVGAQLTADRYTYLPSLGLFFGAVFALPLVATPRLQRLLAAAAGAVLLSLVAHTLTQTTYWRNSEAMFARALEVSPGNGWVLGARGLMRLNRGHHVEALVDLTEAVRLLPGDGFTRSNLALALAQSDRLAPAVVEATKAAALSPGDPYVRLNQARVLLAAGRAAEAAPLFESVARAKLYDVAVDADWGLALVFSGQAEAGLAKLRALAAAAPGDALAQRNLALALAHEHRFAEAKEALEQALSTAPDDARSLDLLHQVEADLARVNAAPP